MNTRDAVNRGLNFFGVAVLSIDASLALFEIFNEIEWIDRLDDLVVTALSVIGIVWYLVGRNRYARNPLPLIFLFLAWSLKMVTVFVTERDDSNAVGPDIGLIVTLGLATIVFAWQYFRARRQLPEELDPPRSIGASASSNPKPDPEPDLVTAGCSPDPDNINSPLSPAALSRQASVTLGC